MKAHSLFILFAFFIQTLNGQTQEDLRVSLNSFCNDYYSDCFSERYYVSGSLSINDAGYISDNEIKVTGYHKYKNYLEVIDNQPFEAIIRWNSSYIEVKFYKKSKNWLGEDYWEDCFKRLYFN